MDDERTEGEDEMAERYAQGNGSCWTIIARGFDGGIVELAHARNSEQARRIGDRLFARDDVAAVEGTDGGR